jgi:hypothetical protein
VLIALGGGLAVLDGGRAASSMAVADPGRPVKSDSLRLEIARPAPAVNAEARDDRLTILGAKSTAEPVIRPVPKPANRAGKVAKRLNEIPALATGIAEPLLGEPMQLVPEAPVASVAGILPARRSTARINGNIRADADISHARSGAVSGIAGGVAGAIGL